MNSTRLFVDTAYVLALLNPCGIYYEKTVEFTIFM